MTVSITSSATLGGSQVSDSLQGGGTGYNFQTSEAGFVPLKKEIYVRHDGLTEIFNFQFYLKAYSQTYGGEYSASADLVKALEQGDSGYGLQVDLDYDGVDFASYSCLSTTLGGSLATAITFPVASIFLNSGGTKVPAPLAESGKLFPTGNAKGDTALMKCRWAVPPGEPSPGRRQVDIGYVYNFTT